HTHSPQTRMLCMTEYIFTITAGRTGTAWLADLMRINLTIPSVHERTELDDFGVQMPDIKTMRMFYERGMNRFVERFLRRKFAEFAHYQRYAESNHALAKCGLVEFLAKNNCHDKIVLLLVRRNHIDQCLSYVTRGDFRNVTIYWQWYLDYRYKHKIVDP